MTAPTQFLALAVRSLVARKVTALLTLVAVALSVALYVGVEAIRQGAKDGFERTLTGTDLIVGARSGQLNLLLYSVFRIGDATNNITWASYQEIANRPEVAWTVPLSLGDSHRGYRVLGTTDAYFQHYRHGDGRQLGFTEGKPFADTFEAVLGAEVARKLGYRLGDRITLAHGVGAVSFAEHSEHPFTVVGILAPTGTPVDRTVHVGLDAIEAIHIGWESGVRLPGAAAALAQRVRPDALAPKQITAFMVGLNNRIDVLRLQRAINTFRAEPLLAIIPGVALSQLWQVVGVAERVLGAVSALVVFVGLLGILTSIMTSLNERRREMAILRSVGAPPWQIFALLVTESAILAAAGAALGVAVVHGALLAAAPVLETSLGVALGGGGPGLEDLAVIGAVTGAAVLLGMLPAWRAFRNALSDGLTIRV